MDTNLEQRIKAELKRLAAGGQLAELLADASPRPAVIYRQVPCVIGHGFPDALDVLVPVPDGYAASHIDNAALPVGCSLFPRLAGGTNPQGTFKADQKEWQLASYHPHAGGGGPPWDPTQHGFDTYLDHLISWLSVLKQ